MGLPAVGDLTNPALSSTGARRALGLGLLAVVCAGLDAYGGSRRSLTLSDPFQIAAALAGLIVLLTRPPRGREIGWLVFGAAGFFAAHRLLLALWSWPATFFGWSLLLAVGLAGTVVLGARVRSPIRDLGDQARFSAAIVILAFVPVVNLFLKLTVIFHPFVRDAALIALDGRFGGQASLAVGRVAALHPALLRTLEAVYLLLPAALSAVVALEIRRRPALAPGALDAFLLAGALGFTLYHVVPVIGPRPVWGARFPWGPVPLFPLAPLDAHDNWAERNCFPSLHTAWALLLYWHARPLGAAVRIGAALWLLLTLLATLGLGQHYLIDLVVALPFAAFVDALVDAGLTRERPVGRRRLLIVTAGFTLAWYGLVLSMPRFSGRAPVWALTAATTMVTWSLHDRWSGRSARGATSR